MPAKNLVKEYQVGGFYHLYNRGVERRKIFQDSKDYAVFLSYLKEYLEPKDEIEIRDAMDNVKYHDRDKLVKKLAMNNFSKEIKQVANCFDPVIGCS